MPKKFDDMVASIKATLKKSNPKMNDKDLTSKAYAIATAQWKKSHGGKTPQKSEALKDWRVLEFFVPIETFGEDVSEGIKEGVEPDFLIRGVAINETTTLNNVKYVSEELEKAAPTFRGVPILLDHKNEIRNIVGRTTEKVNFNSIGKRIDFEGKIMDKGIREMIKDGRIQNVSIGAKVDDLVEESDGSKKAIGIRGLEISLVAVPGDSQANLAQAIDNSFHLREMAMGEEDEYDEEKEDEEATDEKVNTELNKDKEENMAEEVAKEIATPVATPVVAESAVVVEQRKELEELKSILAQKKKVLEETKALEAKKDETKGVVAQEEVRTETANDIVVERASNGKGFDLYGDYKQNPKLKRLVR